MHSGLIQRGSVPHLTAKSRQHVGGVHHQLTGRVTSALNVAQINETEVQDSTSSLHQTTNTGASEAAQPQQQRSGHGSSSVSSSSSDRPQQRQWPAAGAVLREPRPFIPQIDVFKFVGDLLGDPQETLKDTLLGSALATDDGPARLFSPVVPKPPGATPAEELPLMYYMPGIDGSGLAAYRQFPRLTRAFDLRCLIIPRTDRSSFEELVDTVAAMIKTELEWSDGGRPVYLLGESFGGILCLALAQKLGDYVDRVVLVNPASSFTNTPWPALGPLLTQLPADVYKLLPFALAPIMSNPISMALNDVDSRAPLPQQASDLLYGLIDLAPQLGALRLVLPPETLAWRLTLLQQGSAWLTPRLKDIQQRVLVLAGDQDLLIPSREEAARLGKALPRARSRILPNRSHALLQEAGVDLVQLLEAEGFYITERRMSNGRPSTKASDGGAASFGKTVPIQLPTSRELQLDSEGLVSTIKRLTSPVYYSTTADGQIVRGLSGVPVHQRPVLLVGNHQFFAGDMYPMINQFVDELGVLPRGLAHPVVFAGPEALTAAGRSSGMREDGSSSSKDEKDEGAGAAQFSSLLSTYGAVPVNGKNMHKLLANGEIVLLYPGGAREAFKRKGETYKIVWPGKAEFVRMAAKFGATIVPFAAIGCDEAVTHHLSAEELEQLQKLLPPLPFRLPWQQREEDAERLRRIPAARVGVNATMEDLEAFGKPGFFTPNLPQRTYFIFRKPIPTSPELAADRAACQALYADIKQEVEDGLGYLLRSREADPYKELLPRLIYEASWGGKRQAPSFEP
uniref:Phospholipid/glycerol acyltransferase domain-containing protein n=1 Tax=Tetradesmus obliquus TaxID=3088 RepID=A0A383WM75_TETOB|eukprot:jgi/Sobl393_1/1600/SZX78560.1